MAGIKNLSDINIGDTITHENSPAPTALPGYKAIKSMVFCGFYPSDNDYYSQLTIALQKIKLTDASLTFEPESSSALGMGYRLGFLGLLHLEIIKERLHREHQLELVLTSPNVVYEIYLKNGKYLSLDNPNNFPNFSEISYIREPMVSATIICPKEFQGGLMQLCQVRRGIFQDMSFHEELVTLNYQLPLNEIVYDFYDQLKSISKGYGSFDYEFSDYQKADLVKIDIFINKKKLDVVSLVVDSGKAYQRGREICEKLKVIIPRHQFEIPIQAVVNNRVVARETISAVRKDVTQKLYGGDVTRKQKLLNKQKKGKKRLRSFGEVRLPNSIVHQILKV
jgi:GTP-binding protein LepA